MYKLENEKESKNPGREDYENFVTKLQIFFVRMNKFNSCMWLAWIVAE